MWIILQNNLKMGKYEDITFIKFISVCEIQIIIVAQDVLPNPCVASTDRINQRLDHRSLFMGAVFA